MEKNSKKRILRMGFHLKKLHSLLCNNLEGFGTYYTEKIMDELRGLYGDCEKGKLVLGNKKEGQDKNNPNLIDRFEISLEYYRENNPEFEKEVQNIMEGILVQSLK